MKESEDEEGAEGEGPDEVSFSREHTPRLYADEWAAAKPPAAISPLRTIIRGVNDLRELTEVRQPSPRDGLNLGPAPGAVTLLSSAPRSNMFIGPTTAFPAT